MLFRLARHPALQFVVLLLLAVIIRSDTFGDPNLHGDEVFYSTMGAAMHHGALPYVDIWDRKPFGLFAIYWLIAAISESALAYQLAATLFAAGTAWCISAIAVELHRAADDGLAISRARVPNANAGSLLAGIAYLLWLAPLQGFGGQSPVFYNLFIASAALLVVRALPALRQKRVPSTVPMAMLLAGAAITVKTTAVVEAAFLGLCCVFALWRSGAGTGSTLRAAVLWAAIGATPTLAIAGAYWALGHWGEYWHAMYTSNVSKPPHWPTSRYRALIMFVFMAPILLIAAFGLAEQGGSARRFTLGWLAAAIGGLCLVPNFYLHYALPLLVPLCVAASAFLAQGAIGFGSIVGLATIAFWISPPFQYGHARKSQEALNNLERAVRRHTSNAPLLVYDGPPQLYMRTRQPFITPLVFPTHLSHLIEKDVSHLSTLGETQRALAKRPGAVVMAVTIRNGPVNEQTHKLVLAYVGQNCRLITIIPTPERMRTDLIAVWGDCGAGISVGGR